MVLGLIQTWRRKLHVEMTLPELCVLLLRAECGKLHLQCHFIWKLSIRFVEKPLTFSCLMEKLLWALLRAQVELQTTFRQHNVGLGRWFTTGEDYGSLSPRTLCNFWRHFDCDDIKLQGQGCCWPSGDAQDSLAQQRIVRLKMSAVLLLRNLVAVLWLSSAGGSCTLCIY